MAAIKCKIYDVPLGERELKIHAKYYPGAPDTRDEPGYDPEFDIWAVWEGDKEITNILSESDYATLTCYLLENHYDS